MFGHSVRAVAQCWFACTLLVLISNSLHAEQESLFVTERNPVASASKGKPAKFNWNTKGRKYVASAEVLDEGLSAWFTRQMRGDKFRNIMFTAAPLTGASGKFVVTPKDGEYFQNVSHDTVVAVHVSSSKYPIIYSLLLVARDSDGKKVRSSYQGELPIGSEGLHRIGFKEALQKLKKKSGEVLKNNIEKVVVEVIARYGSVTLPKQIFCDTKGAPADCACGLGSGCGAADVNDSEEPQGYDEPSSSASGASNNKTGAGDEVSVALPKGDREPQENKDTLYDNPELSSGSSGESDGDFQLAALQTQCSDGVDNDNDGKIDFYKENRNTSGGATKTFGIWQGFPNPQHLANQIAANIQNRNLNLAKPSAPIVAKTGVSGGGNSWNLGSGSFHHATLTQACRALGYYNWKSVGFLDGERSGRYPNGKANYHSPHNNHLWRFYNGNFRQESAEPKYGKMWAAKLVCQTPLGACADGLDNDGDGKRDLADSGCRNKWDTDEREDDKGCSGNGDDSEAIPAVELISPDNGVHLKNRFPTFKWTHANSADKYRLLVIDKTRNDNVRIDHTMSGREFTPASNLLPGRYVWRVRALASDGEMGPFSETYTLFIDSECEDGVDNDGDGRKDKWDPGCWTNVNDPDTYDSSLDNESRARKLDQASITAPANNSVFYINQKPTVKWAKVEGAVQYRFYLIRQGDSEPHVDYTPTGRSWTPTGTLPLGVFRAKVLAIGAAGERGPWSAWRYFTVTSQCSDGLDNDNDGLIDAADPACGVPQANDESLATTQCQDGKNNDPNQDDDVDADDPGCWTDPNDSSTYERTRNRENAAARVGKTTLLTPESGSVLYTRQPEFTWQAVAGATHYRFYLRHLEGNNPHTDFTPSGTSHTPTGLLPFGNYRWTVHAFGPGGYIGEWSETTTFEVTSQCRDGQDNDDDGLIDLDDPGCQGNPASNDESGATTQCQDGLDNDSDGLIDFPEDTGCESETDNDEGPDGGDPTPACADGLDNDNDGLIDGLDPGCSNPDDDDESDGSTECQDGIDNDSDGLIDYKDDNSGDPDCDSETDDSERPGEGFFKCEIEEDFDDPVQVTSEGGGNTFGKVTVIPFGANGHQCTYQILNKALHVDCPANGGVRVFLNDSKSNREAEVTFSADVTDTVWYTTEGPGVGLSQYDLTRDFYHNYFAPNVPAGTEAHHFEGIIIFNGVNKTIYGTNDVNVGLGFESYYARIRSVPTSNSPTSLTVSQLDAIYGSAVSSTLSNPGWELAVSVESGKYIIDNIQAIITSKFPLGCSPEPTQCSDGVDNDGDGDIDLDDQDCEDEADDSEDGEGGTAECSDGIDNDGDRLIDFGQDPDCDDENDDSEAGSGNEKSECEDGADNDADGLIDLGDPGCENADDDDESDGTSACQDGEDNDSDGLVDLNDPGCSDPTDDDESDGTSACQDGEDNDSDGLVDLNDPGCSDPTDDDESDGTSACQDGEDNDSDGLVDLDDPGCANPQDDDESDKTSQCQDGEDNDSDGLVDLNDPGCANPQDDDESDGTSACQDGQDNDSDGLVDLNDPGCASPQDDDESDGTSACQDGEDNDSDGLVDLNDPGCADPTDDDEGDGTSACQDGEDNDSDGLVDLNDPGCANPQDDDESDGTSQCQDGEDNDGDGLVDLNDHGCSSPQDDDESDGTSACQDGEDNDSDGLVDLNDPGCADPQDDDESDGTSQCQDDLDNDSDGLVDLKDPGCSDPTDDDESDGTSACQDGEDNDNDGFVDLDDPGCESPQDDDEGDGTSQCQDGLDNDSDGLVDLNDPGCADPQDDDEGDGTTQCQDGLDNDLDWATDFPDDYGCDSEQDDDEGDKLAACQDQVDNDGDKLVDGADPGCSSPQDNDESDGTTQCQDGIDNDGDGLIDFGEDPDCEDPGDNNEDPENKLYVCEFYEDFSDAQNVIVELEAIGFNKDSCKFSISNGVLETKCPEQAGYFVNILGTKSHDSAVIDFEAVIEHEEWHGENGGGAGLTMMENYFGHHFMAPNRPGGNFPGATDQMNIYQLPYNSVLAEGGNGTIDAAGRTFKYQTFIAPPAQPTTDTRGTVFELFEGSEAFGELVIGEYPHRGRPLGLFLPEGNYNVDDIRIRIVSKAPIACAGSASQCSDGEDNDGDGDTDMEDPGCSSPDDDDEGDEPAECQDGLDNDGDGLTDMADPGCADENDDDESDGTTQCQDGLDNDSDGLTDDTDPGCENPQDDDESDGTTQCQDGLDNDSDGLTDDADPGCENPQDDDESDGTTQCQDGLDNDSDGLIDLKDPGCENEKDNDESDGTTQCQDGLDNDSDGLTDDADPGCENPQDDDESDGTTQCQDGIDNEPKRPDGLIDREDPGCYTNGEYDPTDNDESDGTSQCQNGQDDDGDSLVDLEDPGCSSPQDDDESDGTSQCQDTLDNENDGLIDGQDPGCWKEGEYDPTDNDESDGTTECQDSVDNEDNPDGLIDKADPGCWNDGQYTPTDNDESDDTSQCQNGQDDDGDNLIDMEDPGCTSPQDNNESDGTSQCQDTLDNDNDGLTDGQDPGCWKDGQYDPTDNDESDGTSQCQDLVDNEKEPDGLIDVQDPGCWNDGVYTPTDNDESDDTSDCQNGQDDDGDDLIDMADPGCSSPQDNDESDGTSQCQDDQDNELAPDGLIDELDPGCWKDGAYVPTDNDESDGTSQCQDGQDNDSDGLIDSNDPGCSSPQDDDESDGTSQCQDGVDNDGDSMIDLEDPGCANPQDNDESDGTSSCQNGVDDDGDGLIDLADPGCSDPTDDDESDGTSACQNGLDDDSDGLVDMDDPGCTSPQDNDESDATSECQDGIDNDGDGLTDLDDPGCSNPQDDDEVEDGDQCPADPNKTEPGECGCGEPDVDSDGDGALNCVDPDDDNDGIADDKECPDPKMCLDTDKDGIPDYLEPNDRDVDGDGDVNPFDPDDDGDDIPTTEECPASEAPFFCRDTDGDGIPDYRDPDDDGPGPGDSDNDGRTDAEECPTGVKCVDTDGDQVPDYSDPLEIVPPLSPPGCGEEGAVEVKNQVRATTEAMQKIIDDAVKRTRKAVKPVSGEIGAGRDSKLQRFLKTARASAKKSARNQGELVEAVPNVLVACDVNPTCVTASNVAAKASMFEKARNLLRACRKSVTREFFFHLKENTEPRWTDRSKKSRKKLRRKYSQRKKDAKRLFAELGAVINSVPDQTELCSSDQ